MREDETVSRAMGINTLTQKLLAFAIGAAFAGLGGALFASRNQFTGPEDFTLMVSINVVAVVIVGGMGNIPGRHRRCAGAQGPAGSAARTPGLPCAGLWRAAGGHDALAAGRYHPVLAPKNGG